MKQSLYKSYFFLVVSLAFLPSSPSKGEVPGLPFEVRQEQNYWCWAALTQAFSAVRNIKQEQCQIVNTELGLSGPQSCCEPGNAPKAKCNPRFISSIVRLNKVLEFSALQSAGVRYLNKRPGGQLKLSECTVAEKRAAPDCKKLNLTTNQIGQGRLSAQELRYHLEAGRPVGLFYKFGQFATGHYIWVAGIYDYQGPGGSPRYLINDPGELMFFSFIDNNRVLTYEELTRGEFVSNFGVRVLATWIATGVGMSQ